MNNIDKELLEVISDTSEYEGAYNIRKNGKGIERKVTDNINIISKTDVSGIDIIVKENTKFEKESFVLIQDILEEAGELEKRVEYETLVTTEFSEKY